MAGSKHVLVFGKKNFNYLFFSFILGNCVFAQGAAATPIDLLKAMTEQGKAKKLKDIVVCHMHTEGEAPYTNPECEGWLLEI